MATRRAAAFFSSCLGSSLITVEETLPEKPKFRDDFDSERKKQKVLSLVLIAIVAVVVILFIISLVRRHL
jgi:cytoskeletal protein RodZ